MDQPVVNKESTDAPFYHHCAHDPDCAYCNGSMEGKDDALDWSFLDGVYCISLQSREDRVESVSAEFHRTGLCRHVLFYRPIKHPKNGLIGSWGSHRAVGQHALSQGQNLTLILEDDVQFSANLRPARIDAIARAIDKLPADWLIFFLGHWPIWSYFVRPDVLRTGSACAHAYIVSPRMLQWLHDHPYGSPCLKKYKIIGKAIDSAYARLPATKAMLPIIAIQSVSESDNLRGKPKKKKRRKSVITRSGVRAHMLRKGKHVINQSGYREFLISKLMRPNQFFIAVLSPLFWMLQRLKQLGG